MVVTMDLDKIIKGIRIWRKGLRISTVIDHAIKMRIPEKERITQ
jgi:hypothetical protein